MTPPKTTRDARKAYLDRTRTIRQSRADELRLERAEQERIQSEFAREKARERLATAKEKKRDIARDERLQRVRAGLPTIPAPAGQPLISSLLQPGPGTSGPGVDDRGTIGNPMEDGMAADVHPHIQDDGSDIPFQPPAQPDFTPDMVRDMRQEYWILHRSPPGPGRLRLESWRRALFILGEGYGRGEVSEPSGGPILMAHVRCAMVSATRELNRVASLRLGRTRSTRSARSEYTAPLSIPDYLFNEAVFMVGVLEGISGRSCEAASATEGCIDRVLGIMVRISLERGEGGRALDRSGGDAVMYLQYIREGGGLNIPRVFGMLRERLLLSS